MTGQSSQLSRYGAIARAIPNLAPSARVFLVCNNSLSWFGGVANAFPPDEAGNTRLFSSLAAVFSGSANGSAITANRGDVVLVAPGHTETISAATTLALNIAGAQIIGLGTGANRPTITFNTATTANVAITGAGTLIQNMIFDLTGFDAIATAFTVSAAGVQFIGNKFILANATNQATAAITTTAGANDLVVQGNVFDGTSDAGTNAAIVLVGGNDVLIRDNTFIGAYGSAVGAISNITTASTNLVIDGNRIANLTTSNTKAITLVSGTTGFISNNRVGILSGTAPFTGAGVYWTANYYAASAGSIGLIQ